ncbi:Checkpoint protein hus1 [Mycoemilia scoparia]|uniref:Checkpoint protein n=1 Tax=Mycoemilia scoparia TaxID=417184 RepID=A0A9W7ZTR6_9FUNG|nr:Checkpoint protein hus1 [Mycoemilia scoparia]
MKLRARVANPQLLTSKLDIFKRWTFDAAFFEYTVESLTNNEIYTELQVEHWQRALKSCRDGEDVTLKLTKRNNMPYLSFQISETGRIGGRGAHVLKQEVPLRILSPQQMENIREPIVPSGQVHIMLPPLHSLRSVAERLKSLGDLVAISANMSGEFTLKVATELVEIETHFRGLVNPEFDTNTQSTNNPNDNVDPLLQRYRDDPTLFATGVIDTKSFINFLYSYHVIPKNIVACIVENHAVIFYVYVASTIISSNLEDLIADEEQTCGALTYYIPSRLS